MLVLADMVRENPPLTDRVRRRVCQPAPGPGPGAGLRGHLAGAAAGRAGADDRAGLPAGEPEPGADQVSIGNSIGSLRFLGAAEWRDFVEAMSVVEQTLRADPAGVYPAMDFATRDHYRHAVEQIAKRSPLSEDEVARKAVELAGLPAARRAGGERRRPHARRRTATSATSSLTAAGGAGARRRVAADAGRAAAAGRAAVSARRLPRLDPADHGRADGPGPVAGGAAWAGAVGAGAVDRRAARDLRQPARGRAGALGGDVARAAADPAADGFLEGHPARAPHGRRGADPAHGRAGVDDLLEALEVRFLANRDENLSFALLTDFRDAAEETTPADAALLQRAGTESTRSTRGTPAEPADDDEAAATAVTATGTAGTPTHGTRTAAAGSAALLPLPSRPALERRRKASGWAGSGSAGKLEAVQRGAPRRRVAGSTRSSARSTGCGACGT